MIARWQRRALLLGLLLWALLAGTAWASGCHGLALGWHAAWLGQIGRAHV